MTVTNPRHQQQQKPRGDPASSVLDQRLFVAYLNSQRYFQKLVRRRPDTNRTFTVDVFSTTSTPGAYIRHAVSGLLYLGRRTGNRNDEEPLFKITIATGENEVCDAPIHLYYDSPEEHEDHFDCVLSPRLKEAWALRCSAAAAAAATTTTTTTTAVDPDPANAPPPATRASAAESGAFPPPHQYRRVYDRSHRSQ